MAGYQLEGPKAARMYEVILPKKLGYFGKVQEVLEDLFDEDAIRSIPFINRSIAERRIVATASFDEARWVKTLCMASGGYSIYEMDGRYVAPRRQADRRAGAGHPVHLSRPRPSVRPDDRLPRRVARSRQPPGRSPLRRGAGRRGADLVPGISRDPPGHLAQGSMRPRPRLEIINCEQRPPRPDQSPCSIASPTAPPCWSRPSPASPPSKLAGAPDPRHLERRRARRAPARL